MCLAVRTRPKLLIQPGNFFSNADQIPDWTSRTLGRPPCLENVEYQHRHTDTIGTIRSIPRLEIDRLTDTRKTRKVPSCPATTIRHLISIHHVGPGKGSCVNDPAKGESAAQGGDLCMYRTRPASGASVDGFLWSANISEAFALISRQRPGPPS